MRLKPEHLEATAFEVISNRRRVRVGDARQARTRIVHAARNFRRSSAAMIPALPLFPQISKNCCMRNGNLDVQTALFLLGTEVPPAMQPDGRHRTPSGWSANSFLKSREP